MGPFGTKIEAFDILSIIGIDDQGQSEHTYWDDNFRQIAYPLGNFYDCLVSW